MAVGVRVGVRVGVLLGATACESPACSPGVAVGVRVGVGVLLGPPVCEPGRARLLELVHARRQGPDLLCHGLELHKEPDQQDERGDDDGDDEQAEEEAEKSFHGGFSVCGAADLFKVAGQGLFHPGAAERPCALKVS